MAKEESLDAVLRPYERQLAWIHYFQSHKNLFLKIGLDAGLTIDDAEDAAMEGVLALLEKDPGSVTNPTQFIAGVIKHKAADHFRKLSCEDCDSNLIDASVDTEISVAEEVSIRQFLGLMKEVVGEEGYSILFDKYGLGMTLNEIAKKQKLTVNQVFYRLKGASKQVKKAIKGDFAFKQ